MSRSKKSETSGKIRKPYVTLKEAGDYLERARLDQARVPELEAVVQELLDVAGYNPLRHIQHKRR
jgi:hypothetical protein